jgi:hypothetical protein
LDRMHLAYQRELGKTCQAAGCCSWREENTPQSIRSSPDSSMPTAPKSEIISN